MLQRQIRIPRTRDAHKKAPTDLAEAWRVCVGESDEKRVS